ncbi:MAG: hypothetical protein Kow0079_04570 [Vicingaceae bacterium]
MNSLIRISVLFVISLFVNCSIAQQNYTINDKKAIKYYEQAQQAFNSGNFELAEVNCLSALEKENNFIEAQLLLAYIYTDWKKYQKAIEAYEKSFSINPSFFPEAYVSAGMLLMTKPDYEKAKKYLSEYLKYDNLNPQFVYMAKTNIANCEFAEKALKNPVDFKPVNLGDGVNSEFPEYFPCITADGKTMLFTRRLNSSSSYTGFNEDFYISFFDGVKWSKAQNLKSINSPNNEGAPTISPNGQFIIFTSCDDPFEGYGKGRQGYGSCDLFYAYKSGNNWSNPRNLKRPVNTEHWESQPSFSSDGKTLYFVRGKRSRSGIKHQDIYVTELSEGGVWTTPVKLSNVINTPGNEESVFIHPDGKTLYFSSDGHPGMGGLDIFMSKKDEDGNWSKPVNLGYPINTHNNENSLLVSADGKLAYFASNREGGYGDLDLYGFELPQEVKPEPVTYLKGKVYDSKTERPLGARFELIDLETGKVVVQSYADEVFGDYLVCLPGNKEYALNVSHEGYLFYSDHFMLTEGTSFEPFIKNVPLKAILPGQSVVLNNVFFETNKYDLKPKSKVELDKLIKFLKDNPTVKIELSGHTDNVGGKNDNQILSENRAKAVFNYLVENGIEKTRLTAKGYGDTQPIADNNTEEGRAKNRRTEFKIIEK